MAFSHHDVAVRPTSSITVNLLSAAKIWLMLADQAKRSGLFPREVSEMLLDFGFHFLYTEIRFSAPGHPDQSILPRAPLDPQTLLIAFRSLIASLKQYFPEIISYLPGNSVGVTYVVRNSHLLGHNNIHRYIFWNENSMSNRSEDLRYQFVQCINNAIRDTMA